MKNEIIVVVDNGTGMDTNNGKIDKKTLLKDLNLTDTGLQKIIYAGYNLLNLIDLRIF